MYESVSAISWGFNSTPYYETTRRNDGEEGVGLDR